MATRICYNCFNEITTEGAFCPHCGYNSSFDTEMYPEALEQGSILNGTYIVGRVLGQGSTGISYVAQEYDSKQKIVIKEYFPREMVGRAEYGRLFLKNEEYEELFYYGRDCFKAEVFNVASIKNCLNIPEIFRYFEENGTAYVSMEYIEGVSLQQYLDNNGGRIDVKTANSLFQPIMNTVSKLHANNVVHGDIAPANILIKEDNIPVIIDNGIARYNIGVNISNIALMLEHGFAPKELYSKKGQPNILSDIYSLAANYYYAITGYVPQDAIDRWEQDLLKTPAELNVSMNSEAETALLKALSINPEERFQNVDEFEKALINNTQKNPLKKLFHK